MDEIPFNPVLGPDLNIPVDESQTVTMKNKSSPRKTAKGRASPTNRARRGIDPKTRTLRFARKMSRKANTSWKRIKSDLQTRLARLDTEQLKRVLAACGVAATAALIIIALAKHAALIVVLLAVLGALVVLNIWNRLLGFGF
jgi:hypothetical protein